MGSIEAKAYLASPEVVAASALAGYISGPRWYERPIGTTKVVLGEGNGSVEEDKALGIRGALDKTIEQVDSIVEGAKSSLFGTSESKFAFNDSLEALTEVLEGFPEKVEGEIVFCDADDVNTDGIYPGKYTYQDNVSIEEMAEICMENYDRSFRDIVKPGDILVSGFNFGCGSSREQAVTAILAKKIRLVVAGSFSNIFSRNSINNALIVVEVPRLVQRLREHFASFSPTFKTEIIEPSQNRKSLDLPKPTEQASPTQGKVLTRRTGWTFSLDIRRSKVTVREGEDGETWSQRVGEVRSSGTIFFRKPLTLTCRFPRLFRVSSLWVDSKSG